MNANGLESAVRLNRILMENALKAGNLTPTQIIACDGLVEEWSPGSFERGDVRKEGGQVWKCCQTHDSTENPDWTPTSQRALWVPYHSKDPAHARPYVAPTMAEDAYQTDEVMLWTDGWIYRCKQDGTVHDPSVLPQAWEQVSNLDTASTVADQAGKDE